MPVHVSSGIRATVAFDGADLCPVVAFSAATGTTVDAVSRSPCPGDGAGTVTEFAGSAVEDPAVDATPIFEHAGTAWYRVDHGDGLGCPCEYLGEHGCPASDYVASDGELTLVFHARDYEQLRAVIGDLRDRFPNADIRRFVRSPSEGLAGDGVFVDRGVLTERQRTVLRRAYEMGYFDRPRGANATEVAEALDIAPSTFSEHLAAVHRKLLPAILEGE